MNKKIPLILTVLIIFITISTVSAGFFDFLESPSTNTTNDEKTLVVGFNAEFPPFGYREDNGSYTGFDLDLAKEVCARNNWTFKAQPIINWESKEIELNSGEIDCIWSEFTINNREKDYTWSDAYFNNEEVFVVKGNSNITSIADLKGKTVEVLSVSSGSSALKVDNKSVRNTLTVKEIKDYNTAFMDLESGVCDAVLVDIGCANYQIHKFNSTNFTIVKEPLKYEQYGIAFKKGNTELKNQVQETLNEMYKDGTVDRIAQNYSDYGIPERIIHP